MAMQVLTCWLTGANFLYAIDVQHYIKRVLNDVFTVKQHSIKCGLRDVLQSAINIK